MRRKAAFVVVMVLAMNCVGCSWMARLVVTNRSDEPIVVEYSTPPVGGRCPLDGEGPSLAESPDAPRNEWVPMAPADFTFLREPCSITFTLPPRTSFLFMEVVNYSGHANAMSRRSLEVYRLRIQPPDGELVVSGSELVRRFEKRSRSLFEMVYDRPDWARK